MREYHMKLNRFLKIVILMVVLVICTGILLSGCASTGDKKDAGPEAKSPRRGDKRSEEQESTGSSPEVQTVPVVGKGGSGEKPHFQEASLKTDEDRARHNAASLKQGLDRILPATLLGTEWNGEVTAVLGILAMALIYGISFKLARRPRRR
jgi:uncharacterized protein YceK